MQDIIPQTGTIGILVIIVLLLVKEFIRGRNGKAEKSCPVIYSGGTPLTKEQHNEVCMARLVAIKAELQYLKDGQAEVKGDLKKILKRVGGA